MTGTFFTYLNDKLPLAYGFLPLACLSTVFSPVGSKDYFGGIE